MENSLYDIIEQERLNRHLLASEHLTLEKAIEIVGKCYPGYKQIALTHINPPFVIVTNEKYVTKKSIKKLLFVRNT